MVCGILRAPCLEQLHELLAGGLLVPIAVAAEAFEQVIDGLGLVAAAGAGDGEVDTRLVVGRIGGDLGLQSGGVGARRRTASPTRWRRSRWRSVPARAVPAGSVRWSARRGRCRRSSGSSGRGRRRRSRSRGPPAARRRRPRRRLQVTGLHGLVGLLEGCGDVGGAVLAEQAVDEGLDLRSRSAGP